jgi:predicted RNase H-like nuclease
VKQGDLCEYEETCKRKAKYTDIQDEAQLPLKPSHKDGKHQFPLQISKVRSIEGFDEDIGQLSLSVYVSHLNISFLNVISQEVVSPLKVTHSFVEE